MIKPLSLVGFFRLVVLFALVLAAWRGLEIISSGALTNPLTRFAVAQDADAETDAEAEAMSDKKAEPKKPKRPTASDVMRERATDVTENMGTGDGPTPTEETVLIRLGERREKIEKMERDLLARARLIEAAEKRVEERIRELKAIEARLEVEAVDEPEDETPALANLVTMYEAMKPKDAARIFNTLDMAVLVAVVEQMKPRTMSAILAAMDSQAAQRLTLSLAHREVMAEEKGKMSDLPKIGSDG